jgi:hypothetical protein
LCVDGIPAEDLCADGFRESEQFRFDTSWYALLTDIFLIGATTDMRIIIALSTSDKIAIGAGVPSLVATIAAAVFTGIQARVAWMKYRDERAARLGGIGNPPMAHPPQQQASGRLCVCM